MQIDDFIDTNTPTLFINLNCHYNISVYLFIYTTLAWAFKGAAQCLTCILPGQYQDIARAISWESSLPMTLMPSQFKEARRFDSLY